MAETKCEELKAEQISASQKGCRVKAINATILMAAQAVNDLIEIGTIKKGERFLYGTITTTTSTGSATVAIGNKTTADKYKTAQAHTNTDVVEVFGKTLAQDVNSVNEVVYAKVGTAALPSAGDGKQIHTDGIDSDGGVMWKYLHSGYGVGTILEVVSPSQIRVNADGYFLDFSYGTYLWELGLIGKDGFYPNCCAFYKERFVYSISTNKGTKICASCAGDYNNFSDNSFGEILAESAITVVLQWQTESEVLWMIAGTKLYIET